MACELVSGDTGSGFTAALTEDGAAADLTGASVRARVRKVWSEEVLFSIDGEENREGDFESGLVSFRFGDNLDIDPGRYEAEVKVTWADGAVETVFKPIAIVVRRKF